MVDSQTGQPDVQRELERLTRRNHELQRLLESAKESLGEMKERLAEVSAPPQTFGTFTGWAPETEPGKRLADVVSSGRRMRVAVAPTLEGTLQPGQDVLLNAMSVVVSAAEPQPHGQAAIVREVVDDEQVLVVARGEDEHVVRLIGGRAGERLHEGDTVVIDTRSGFATARVERTGVEALLLEEIPDVSYAQIGGLEGQIERIRDAIELPLTHRDLYAEHALQPPRGLLLYGPPGCGKTLIAKAVAHSLGEVTGHDRSYFLSVKGPELLNKYVGETERYIRTIFERARSKAAEGAPVVVFFDEMDALFRSRGSGVSSDMETTIVPQLLTELDGVESLANVIVIGASNREDMIDPAILRPGRLDVKIEIARPDRDSAVDILTKYLTADIPLAGEADAGQVARSLREAAADYLFEPKHGGAPFVSGAMLRNIVDRAKTAAIKSVVGGGPRGITRDQVLDACAAEIAEARAVAGSSLRES